MGINPGEYLGILFSYTLNPNQAFASVNEAINSTAFRIGIHVQGFADGGSESFINNPAPVPEPATLLLLGTGLIGVAAFGRKRLVRK